MQPARISSRKYPPPTPTVGQWKFLGGGGTKEYKFSKDTTEIFDAHKKNFPQGRKRHNRSYETYLSICGLF